MKYFYRDLPMPFHPHSMPAAEAARCAAERGKLWEMHDSLFAEPASLDAGDIEANVVDFPIAALLERLKDWGAD